MTNNLDIIGEISSNHGNNIENVKKAIYTLKKIGATAAKIQTYTPDTITLNCKNDMFSVKLSPLWDGMNLYDLYSQAYTPWEWHKDLFEYSRSINFTLFSTPFDFTAVDLLEECQNPIYKISSFEINDIPLIEYVAKKNKPIIISTGTATLQEIEEAVEACKKNNNYDITLLKCTSEYPAKIKDANLNTMVDMKNKFRCKVGISDHTIGSHVPIIATSLGANVIEKHFILDKKMGGPDSKFSMDTLEFSEMIKQIKLTKQSLGKVDYSLTQSKKLSRKYSRSLFASKDIKKGEKFTPDNLKSIRPNNGLAPKYYYDIIGKTASQNICFATPMNWELINKDDK